MTLLRDSFSRVIDYLRVSIIDRCNLRCLYCMPHDGIEAGSHDELLTYEEISRIVGVAARLGVKKVRITGGEPLIRRNLPFLVESLKHIQGIEDLSLTTNGILLKQQARQLTSAGLDRVNISLDSFKPDRYREMTRGGDLNAVLEGLKASEEAGLTPLKINMVPVRGFNDDEIEDFAAVTLSSDYQVRFIECMPSAASGFWNPERYIRTDEIKRRIEAFSSLEPVRLRKHGPSRYFRLKGGRGVIGFISALTHHFCEECNRLRLTADGKLRPCLFSETEIDLRAALRSGMPDSEIERLLMLAIEVKPKGHELSVADPALLSKKLRLGCWTSLRPMSRIGG